MNKLKEHHLNGKAIVYIRQSTAGQVQSNHESRIRQYALEERARSIGFRNVEVIDEDLGRSGSGKIHRPGFERLIAEVCTGSVGAVFALEASRLARNGGDWHRLIEICGVVHTLLIDHDGIYDPCLVNDRLLLGVKGTMSEFEVGLFRQRAQEAIDQKASRGELRFILPVGYRHTEDKHIDRDPDHRVQQLITLIFTKYEELGSVRQALLWFHENNISVPAMDHRRVCRKVSWKPATYAKLYSVITNPIYAGAYAYGKTENRTSVVEGKLQQTAGHRRPRETWKVLLREHHPSYISWEQYEKNQQTLLENAHMMQTKMRKAARGGRGLLAGLLRCGHCGRMLHISYRGIDHSIPHYRCFSPHSKPGKNTCLNFSGRSLERAVSDHLLAVVEPKAIEAAFLAANMTDEQHRQQCTTTELELQQARYEARLAERRYEAVDPEQRLVATELESRWNAALARIADIQKHLDALNQIQTAQQPIDREALFALAQDLPSVWNHQETDMRLKQRIARLLIQEIIASHSWPSDQIVYAIHWVGGQHTEGQVARVIGRPRQSTEEQIVEQIRQMAGNWTDQHIAATLNRIGARTGKGNSWTRGRVRSLRAYHKLPAFDPSCPRTKISASEAASRLNISRYRLKKLIDAGEIVAIQVIEGAPLIISVEALDPKNVVSAPLLQSHSMLKTDRGENLTIPGL